MLELAAQAAAHLSFHPGRLVGPLLDTARGKLLAFRDFEVASLLQAIGELGLEATALGGAPARLLAALEQQPALLERVAGVRSKGAFVGAFSAVVMLEVGSPLPYILCPSILDSPPSCSRSQPSTLYSRVCQPPPSSCSRSAALLFTS